MTHSFPTRRSSDLAAGELDLIVCTADRADADAERLIHDPAVWVTSVAHETHLCDPLPVALFEPGCWWRDRAMQILEEHGRRYRIACTAHNTRSEERRVGKACVSNCRSGWSQYI